MAKHFLQILLGFLLVQGGLSRAWAQTSPVAPAPSTATAAGIRPDSVTIIRDSLGFAHIDGPDDAHVAYGLAWAQCEDQLPKVQTLLLTSRGGLASLAGIYGAAVDFYVAFIGARRFTDSLYQSELSPEYRHLAEAFAAGVTDFCRAHPDRVLRPDALPFTGRDVVAAFVVLLSGMVGMPEALQDVMLRSQDLSHVAELLQGGASNAYAASPQRTTDGSTMLCTNPHLDLRGLGTWYVAHLHSRAPGGLHTIGGHFAAMPTPGLGGTPGHGWGLTFNYPDMVDTYALKWAPGQRGKAIWVDGQAVPVVRHRVRLRVALLGGKRVGARLQAADWWLPAELPKARLRIPVRRSWYQTPFGPAVKGKKGRLYALRAAVERMPMAAEQWYRMALAQNQAQFQAALEIQGLPMFNVVYADSGGQIGYQFNALLPCRPGQYQWQRLLPGINQAVCWGQYVPLHDLPQVWNPPSGYVYNTNNSPFRCTAAADNPSPRDSANQGFYLNALNNRDLRFEALMAQYPRLSWATFRSLKYDDALQADSTNPVWRHLQAFRQLNPAQHPNLTEAIVLLRQWDLRSNAGNSGAALARLALANLYYQQLGLGWADPAADSLITEVALARSLQNAQKHLLRFRGRLDAPYGDLHRLSRDAADHPVSGMPDVLQATAGRRAQAGTIQATFGDSYIHFQRWHQGQTQIELMLPFGNTDRPDHPQRTHLLESYAWQQTIPMTFDWDHIRRHAARVYHPLR